MSESTPAPAPNDAPPATPVRRRSPIERAVVWGGILVLLLFVLMEWQSKSGFEATLSNVDTALERGAFPMEELSKHLHGFAFQSESEHDKQRMLTVSWPSLAKSYQLRMPIEQDNKIVSVDTVQTDIPAESAMPSGPSKPQPANTNSSK